MPRRPLRMIKVRSACSTAQMLRAISVAALFALLLAWTLREVPASAAPAAHIFAAR
ncbi:hypothetical protein DES32_2820 [Methylovirgula ligni]|uniref:Uncharacterized protein n=1 Tax=Methylovirgula ligni TaxID=569860 RepID=A0A3D9YQ41_9HYPH|nr:hypothetical protein [Methylovirgula ligni]REF84707.1 hypothetical protein DES32_2820 [Methylovirgula ligni]